MIIKTLLFYCRVKTDCSGLVWFQFGLCVMILQFHFISIIFVLSFSLCIIANFELSLRVRILNAAAPLYIATIDRTTALDAPIVALPGLLPLSNHHRQNKLHFQALLVLSTLSAMPWLLLMQKSLSLSQFLLKRFSFRFL